ncbi:MAG TPA: DinB family protein [Terriglobales bacterium]
MKKTKYVLLCFSLLLFGVSAFSQTNSSDHQTVAGTFNANLSNVEHEFVSAAEAMPADKYAFAPTNGEFKGVRTFALQVRHVATVNYEFASVILREKNPVEMGSEENGSDTLKSKDEIVKYLKDSFAYLHKALGSLNEQNLVTPIKSPWGKGTVTRLGIALIAVSHPFDHYGQMVEYLRANSIVPPASRR